MRGTANGEPVVYTADTGASRTIISTRVYNKISEASRPELDHSACIVGAGGALIKGVGKAVFNISLGPLELQQEVFVADIEDEALLGYDILRGSNRGPADILLSKNRIELGGVDIPTFQIGCGKRTRRVVVADDIRLPGQAEAVVSVFLERFVEDDYQSADFIVEPTDHFKENYPLQMACTLVNANQGPTCKIRILNPFPTEVTLKQDAEIGKAEKIERVVSMITAAEHEQETHSFECLRRVQLNTCVDDETVGPLENLASESDVPVHLKGLFEKSTMDRTHYERQVIAGLLVKYQDVFSRSDWDIGLTDLAEHSINTGDAPPIKQMPRRVPLAHAEEEKKAIEDLLKKGVIRKSTSPWASPIVLVKKKSGAIRPCVDYRKVNALVRPDGFPLPRVQDCLDAVAGATLFSSFDLTSGYFQIPLKEEDIPKSAFCCKFGHYEMTRMPFGLNNAASTFQRTMEIVLQGLQWETCLVYIDDIIVYGSDLNQHVKRVEQVLERIKAAGLKLKPEKCHMLRTKVVFLGHVVSKDGVLPDPTNVMKIADWPRPTTQKQVKQFVATGSFYRRFVRDFAKIVRPLINLTKKDVPFHWSEDCESAFNQLKKILMGPEIMGYPLDKGGTFLLDTDASGTGIGAVLSQMQAGRERVIAYASRGMSKAERNYCVTEQELLAVVFFIQYFRQYLLGRKFVVQSDHQALIWLFRLREPSGKIARWIEILAPYDFEIQYRPGNKMAHADALSRCASPKDCECSEVDTSEPLKCGPCAKCLRRAEMMVLQLPKASESSPLVDEQVQQPAAIETSTVRAITNQETEHDMPSTSKAICPNTTGGWCWSLSSQELVHSQMKDPDIAPILLAKREGRRPSIDDMESKSPACRHYWIVWDNLILKEGVLCKVYQKLNGTGNFDQLVLPRSLWKEVLSQMHSSALSGHFGVRKTKEKISQRYYWYNQKQEVKDFIKNCDICASDKPPPGNPKAPMGHLKSGAPWDTLALDYLGPFPQTKKGNRYILVMTDTFTKYVEAIPVPNQKAEDCARVVVNDFVSRWGTPLRIHSDQGTAFESRVFNEMCRLLSVRKTRTSPRNPRGNGQTERFNRTLLKMMRAYLSGEQEDWDQNLGCLTGAYRATPNESTNLSPNLLSLGREIRLPVDVVYGHKEGTSHADVPGFCDYIEDLRDRMLHAHEVARKYLCSNAKRSKAIYDTRLVLSNYSPGDLVWYLHETRKVGICPKLEKRYDGPFVVKRKLSELNFELQFDKEGTYKVVHHNKLKPYEGESPPKWTVAVSKRIKRLL